MNLHRNYRFSNHFMTIVAIAVLFILMAFTIQIFSEAFHYVDALLESSGRQAGQLVTVMSINR